MIKRTLYGAASKLIFQPWFRQTRGLTLGVRVAVFDAEGRVFLIRHTYAPGWLFPGGGVERNETAQAAALREIREEGGILTREALQLHGIHSNHENYPGDHIVSFVLRAFEREAWKPNVEIAEAGFFPIEALPEGATGGTRRRIAEITQGLPVGEYW
jgi:8-oxo-dGTP pyrophosphatase MutT (NUDIX family)